MAIKASSWSKPPAPLVWWLQEPPAALPASALAPHSIFITGARMFVFKPKSDCVIPQLRIVQWLLITLRIKTSSTVIQEGSPPCGFPPSTIFLPSSLSTSSPASVSVVSLNIPVHFLFPLPGRVFLQIVTVSPPYGLQVLKRISHQSEAVLDYSI